MAQFLETPAQLPAQLTPAALQQAAGARGLLQRLKTLAQLVRLDRFRRRTPLRGLFTPGRRSL